MAAGVVGAIVGLYCGLNILIPLFGSMIVFAQIKRVQQARWKPFLAAVAIIIGHLLWMIVGAIIVPAQAMAIVPDIIVMLAGILWLILRPGLGPVILLVVFEVLCVVINGFAILPHEFGSPIHKALVAHLALRLGTICSLIVGYLEWKKRQATTPPPLPSLDVETSS